jgi:O-methyltransferase involved in polyketide biosynthesis
MTPPPSGRNKQAPSGIDTSVPHSARIWNYWVGGKDNYPIDREVGARIAEMVPDVYEVARQSRAFLGRAVRFLAGEAGIRQFLDVGTGLPTHENTHEVAQRIAPESRIVYVDNDPLVLVHAQALLTSSPEGVTDYIQADVREPDAILNAAAEILDFDRPIALMLLGVMGNVVDDDEAYTIVKRLLNALPPGSYMAFNDSCDAVHGEERAQALQHWNEQGGSPYTIRSPEQITRFFDGLEILEPGVVSTSRWRPDTDPLPTEVGAYCGIGRKP